MTGQISFKKNDWVFHTGTMILAICVVVDGSICLGHSDLRFFINFEASSILPGCNQILHQLLVLRALAIWIWYPWLLLLSFEMLMIPVQWIPHKIQNHLSQCRLGVQLDLCIFGALSPIRHSSNDRCPSMRRNELLCPSSLLHRSPLIYFWLLFMFHAGIFSNFPIPYQLLPLLREFSWLEV